MKKSALAWLLPAAVLLAACSPAAPRLAPTRLPPSSGAAPSAPPPAAVQPPAAALSPSLTPALTPASQPALLSSPTASAQPIVYRGLSILAAGLSAPDDLLLAADGSIYFSDIGDGTLRQLGLDGQVKVFASGLDEPEGIVQLPGGDLVVAEQGKNRLVRVDPLTGRITTFVDLPKRTGNPGVDGIALEDAGGSPQILVPDSPNGRLLRASLDGAQVQTIAGGFLRPTGAFPEASGDILVADEDAGEIIRLKANGSRQVLARLPLADDVIEDPAGNIFAISISAGQVYLIPAGEQQGRVLAGGLSSPQGICFDAQGNLVVAEAGKSRLVRLQIRAP